MREPSVPDESVNKLAVPLDHLSKKTAVLEFLGPCSDVNSFEMDLIQINDIINEQADIKFIFSIVSDTKICMKVQCI